MHPDELVAMARNMIAHLRRLLDQRDAHLEVFVSHTEDVKEPLVSFDDGVI